MWRNDHTAFRVRDLDRAIAFYVDVLDMPLMFREIDEAHGEAFAFLQLDGGNLELLQALDGEVSAPPAPEPPYTPHLALATDDLDAVRARLETAETPIIKGPMEIPGKVRWLYLADPDNNVIEFVQWLES